MNRTRAIRLWLAAAIATFASLASAGMLMLAPSPHQAASVESGDWQLATGHYEPAKIPLEIVAPAEGLSTLNRYYKAYPGIPARWPVVVLGGAWPFKYELVDAPPGMTIGETLDQSAFGTAGLGGANLNYGVIEWDNPTTSGSPHNVQVRVTDQQNSIDTATWSLTVTVDGFLFLDAVNGSDGNAGTLASPKQTINGWYNSAKSNSAYDTYFVYYREGDYNTDDAPIETDGGPRMAVSSTKPVVHLGYPGETSTIHVNNSFWIQYSAGGNGFYGGLRWEGNNVGSDYKALVIASNESDSVVFENTFAIADDIAPISSNASQIYLNSNGAGSRFGIVRNVYEGTGSRDLVLIYTSTKGVFEGNTISNSAGGNGHGVYFKIGPNTWTVRANRGPSNNSTKLVRFDRYTPLATDVEVCWNYWRSTGNGWYAGDEAGVYGDFWLYRNTWDIGFHEINNTVTGGLIEVTRDITQHNGSFANGVDIENGSTLTPTYTDSLIGTSGLVDASGLMAEPSRSTLLGIRGHEVH